MKDSITHNYHGLPFSIGIEHGGKRDIQGIRLGDTLVIQPLQPHEMATMMRSFADLTFKAYELGAELRITEHPPEGFRSGVYLSIHMAKKDQS